MGSDKSLFWKDWQMSDPPEELFQWETAPKALGFYEIGLMTPAGFQAKYAGRAASKTLQQRIKQHYELSHNPNIREHRHHAWFRWKVLDSFEMACFVEGVHLIAFEYDRETGVGYEWNGRQEWKKQWILEYLAEDEDS